MMNTQIGGVSTPNTASSLNIVGSRLDAFKAELCERKEFAAKTIEDSERTLASARFEHRACTAALEQLSDDQSPVANRIA